MTFCVSVLESWWGFWRGFWCGFWNISRMSFDFTSVFFWQVFLSGSACTASISWFTFSCSFLIERNVLIISSSFGSIYSSLHSDSYQTRRWWFMILPTIVIFISQGTSFKFTLNERASSVMLPTNFDCVLCSSIDDKFCGSAYLHRQMPYNFSREISFEYFNRKWVLRIVFFTGTFQ